MDNLVQIGRQLWLVATAMAPYLLLGFLAAGLLSVLIPPALVEKHLGRRGFWQAVKATLLGVPMPLCSCGVIPVAVSLRRHGASKGATVAFLASTPQTGVDSMLSTWALLGPLVTVFRVVVAFVSGILSGVLVECCERAGDQAPSDGSCACHPDESRKRHALVRALRYGFIGLPRDIGRAVLLGLLLSGLMGAFIPADFFAGTLRPGLPSMLLMLLVGVPLYVCSTGSIPVAFALLRAGLSPGAALVFLVTGPATNAASLTTLWSLFGRKVTGLYLAVIALTALGAGLLLDAIPGAGQWALDAAGHDMTEVGWGAHLAAGVLLLLLLPSLRKRGNRRQAAQ